MTETINSNIKEWYSEEFKNDELKNEIKDNVSFEDLFRALDNYKNVYDTLGVEDSIVRERIFEKLSEIMNVDYEYIYSQWMKQLN